MCKVSSRFFVGCVGVFLRLLDVMPVSKEQMDLLKDGSTPIQFAKDNPKKIASKAWDKYEQYKGANSILQAMERKAGWQDLPADFEKGFRKIMKHINVEMQGRTKRPAPEGTPDREAQARTKSQTSDLIPRSLPTGIEDPISLTASRMVMPEEITNGMSAMENRLMNRMDEQMQDMKGDIEKGLLESQFHHLEAKQKMKIGWTKWTMNGQIYRNDWWI